MSERATLTCTYCSEVVAEGQLDANGNSWFYEDQNADCPTCGLMGAVSIDEDNATAYVSHGDEDYKDIGQPLCDGSCGAAESWWRAGKRCSWTCHRAGDGCLP